MFFLHNKMLRILLWPLSLLYLTVIFIRNKLYDTSIFKSFKINSLVVSIGNISVGGTGKTPVIIALAELLRSKGKKVAILSRGYGRKSRGVVIVSHGRGPACKVEIAGDEPFLLATELPDIPFVVAENRIAGARELCRLFAPEIILLDDGFQHRKIKRDLDIVLIDSKRLLYNKSLLPAGPYREGLRSLRRAHFILPVNCCAGQIIVMKILCKKTAASLYPTDINSQQLTLPNSGTTAGMQLLRHKKVLVFCGIGQPEKLRETLRQAGAEIIAFMTFPDHFDYQEEDLDKLISKFNNSSAELIISTAKDWVKIKNHKGFRQVPVCLPDHKAKLSDEFISAFLQWLQISVTNDCHR